MENQEKVANKSVIRLIGFISLLSILSCSEKRGSEMSAVIYKDKSDIVANKISKSEVVERYKDPTYKWKDKSGNEVYNYQYVTEIPFEYSYIPIISVFIRPISKINRYDISLTFDKNDNRLIETSFSSEEFKR